MVAPGSQWPALSGELRENSADQQTIHDRVLAANHDAQQLLDHVDKGGELVPAPVLECLKGIQELTADLMRNPLGSDWRKEFAELKQETIELRKEMHAIKIATTAPAASRSAESGPRARS